MGKLWAGRFLKEEDPRVNDFNSSVSFDPRMFREDIAGSIAHASMLGAQGVISPDEAQAITSELERIRAELEQGRLSIEDRKSVV